jgi:hypothetical protein
MGYLMDKEKSDLDDEEVESSSEGVGEAGGKGREK